MKDTKSLLLLLVSLLLVLVSLVLVVTWGYNFYKSNDNTKINPSPLYADSANTASLVRDSLQKIYAETLQDFDTHLDSTLNYSDSLKTQLDIKLAEFYRLRFEIAEMLKSRNSNGNFTIAQQKISELQNKVTDLKVKNDDVYNENKKLSEALNQISIKETKGDKDATKQFGIVEKSSNIVESGFVTSNLKLAALSGVDDTETNQAEKTNRFAGSFIVTNFNSQLSRVAVEVVLLRPDGTVVKASDWDSGTFTTSDGKRKIYSYKFSFNYNKAEAKPLQFSVKDSNIKSGTYTMELYNNGVQIGKIVKRLS